MSLPWALPYGVGRGGEIRRPKHRQCPSASCSRANGPRRLRGAQHGASGQRCRSRSPGPARPPPQGSQQLPRDVRRQVLRRTGSGKPPLIERPTRRGGAIDRQVRETQGAHRGKPEHYVQIRATACRSSRVSRCARGCNPMQTTLQPDRQCNRCCCSPEYRFQRAMQAGHRRSRTTAA